MEKTVFNIIELNENSTFSQQDLTAVTISNYGDSDLDLVFPTGVRLKVPKYDAVNLSARSFGVSDRFPFDMKVTVEFVGEKGRAVIVYHQVLIPNKC